MQSVRTTTIVCLLAALTCMAPAIARASVLYGVDYGSNTTSKLYTIRQSTGAATLIGDTDNTIYDLTSNPSVSGFTLFGVDNVQNALDQINPATGTTVAAAINGLQGVVGSTAFNAVTQKLFVTTLGMPGPTGDTTDTLYSVDLVPDAVGEFNATRIGATGVRNILALSFDIYGVLFGVSDVSHTLVTISTATGAVTKTSPFALRQVYALAADPDDGQMYATSSQTHFLYAVDTTTATTSRIGLTYGDINFDGLAFAASPIVSTVPEPASLAMFSVGLVALRTIRRGRGRKLGSSIIGT